MNQLALPRQSCVLKFFNITRVKYAVLGFDVIQSHSRNPLFQRILSPSSPHFPTIFVPSSTMFPALLKYCFDASMNRPHRLLAVSLSFSS